MAEELFGKILKHPDKEEIVKRLLDGSSVKEVEAWLKKRYAKNKRYQISFVTLQSFRKANLKLEGEVLENIKQARMELKKNESEAQLKDLVTNSSAYQEKLNEIVSNELDTTRKILELEKIISSRMEYYFNQVAAGGAVANDKMLLEYLNSYRSIIQDWKKYVEGVADTKIEHNINIQVVNDQISILKNVVFETLQELDPKLVPLFIDKVNKRLSQADTDDSVYRGYRNKVIDVIPD